MVLPDAQVEAGELLDVEDMADDEVFIIEDGRDLPVFLVEKLAYRGYAPRIGATAFAVYVGILASLTPETHEAVLTHRQLAANLDTSVSSVKRAITALKAAKMVAVREIASAGRRKANGYRPLNLTPPAPVIALPPAKVLPLWDVTVGAVADAADHAAKIGALIDAWHICFGADATVTPAQIQQLVTAASGDYEAVAQECLKLVARLKPPIRQPFGLVRSNLTGEWKNRNKPQPVRRPAQPLGYGTVQHDDEEIPF